MALNTLMAFWGVSILFIITPGIDWAYTIAAGIRGKVVVPAVLGLVSGHFLATLVVAAGVGALVASQPMILTILTLCGAFYLLWMGVSLFRQPATISTMPTGNGVDDSHYRWAIKGICVSGLNPKVLLLFLALLPQFIETTTTWSVTTQIATLGAVHLLSCTIIYLLVGLSAQALLKTRPQATKIVSRISAILMVLIAVLLLTEQVVHMSSTISF